MKKILLIGTLITMVQLNANAQGCVAIRSTGSSCAISKPGDDSSTWSLNANYRHFKSFRHFKGKEEQKERLVEKSEVINYSNSLDISITKKINKRWSLNLNFPMIANTRSSLYEHGLVNGTYIKKERRNTHSFGLGDVRFAAYTWIIDPEKHTKFNVQAGLGIKFATGDYKYQDYWYNVGANGAKELRSVDQSIQLGDGGTGFTTELNAYYMPTANLNFYANTYYLFNPRNTNGTRTYFETLSRDAGLAASSYMSVPDQYMARIGASYSIPKLSGLSFSLGGRIEGLPAVDLIGKSDAFRRPGYIISVEPGISYAAKRTSWYISVPVALERNRIQSVIDREQTALTGVYRIGDAAFADYAINIGMAVKF